MADMFAASLQPGLMFEGALQGEEIKRRRAEEDVARARETERFGREKSEYEHMAGRRGIVEARQDEAYAQQQETAKAAEFGAGLLDIKDVNEAKKRITESDLNPRQKQIALESWLQPATGLAKMEGTQAGTRLAQRELANQELEAAGRNFIAKAATPGGVTPEDLSDINQKMQNAGLSGMFPNQTFAGIAGSNRTYGDLDFAFKDNATGKITKVPMGTLGVIFGSKAMLEESNSQRHSYIQRMAATAYYGGQQPSKDEIQKFLMGLDMRRAKNYVGLAKEAEQQLVNTKNLIMSDKSLNDNDKLQKIQQIETEGMATIGRLNKAAEYANGGWKADGTKAVFLGDGKTLALVNVNGQIAESQDRWKWMFRDNKGNSVSNAWLETDGTLPLDQVVDHYTSPTYTNKESVAKRMNDIKERIRGEMARDKKSVDEQTLNRLAQDEATYNTKVAQKVKSGEWKINAPNTGGVDQRDILAFDETRSYLNQRAPKGTSGGLVSLSGTQERPPYQNVVQ